MQGVAAGLDDQVHCATGIASRLWAGLCLRGEFVNGVNRQNDARNPRYTALVDCGDVMPKVIIIHAVDLPIDLVRTGPIE